MCEPNSNSNSVDQNSGSTKMQRAMEAPENWPTVKEMESALKCVHCNRTPSYPFMQCCEGHLICEKEGMQFERCPAAKSSPDGGICGASLVRLRLRWFKWMTERASYECPIEDCSGSLLGQHDRECHMTRMHPPESGSDALLDPEHYSPK